MAARGEVGTRIVLEGYELYIRQLDNVAKKEREAGDAAAQAGQKSASGAGGVNQLSTAFSSGAGQALKFGAALVGVNLGAQAAIQTIQQLVGAFLDYERGIALLAARTGASKEEVAALGQTIRDLGVENFRSSRTEIAATVEAVISLEGVAASSRGEIARLAQNALDLAQVFGGDGVQAVRALDDVLDAWNLTAEDGVSLADRLTVSYQRFGAEVPTSLAALQSLAPTLQALDVSLDDAIALLNAFADNGVKAESTTRAMQTAVALLTDDSDAAAEKMRHLGEEIGLSGQALRDFLEGSPGERFQELIRFFQSTATEAEKVKVAIDLFGPSGVKFAQVLSQIDLKSFAVDADSAAGAMQRAGDTARETADSGWAKLSREIENFAIVALSKAAPAASVLADALGLLAQALDQIDTVDAILALESLAVPILPGGILWDALKAFEQEWNDFWPNLPTPIAEAADKIDGPLGWISDRLSDAANTAVQAANFVRKSVSDMFKNVTEGPQPPPDFGTSAFEGGAVPVFVGPGRIAPGTRTGAVSGLTGLQPLTDIFENLFNFPDIISGFTGVGPGQFPFKGGGGAGAKGSAKEAAKTVLDGFVEALDELRLKEAMERKFSEAGAAAIVALARALQEGASASEGAAVVGLVEKLIDDAREAGIPNAEQLGEDVSLAIARALSEKTPEAAQAAIQALGAFASAAADARVATEAALDQIGAALDAAVEQTGDAADQLAQTLVNAITRGTPEAVRGFEAETRRFVAAAREAGVETGSALMDALQAAIREGTPAAVSAALDAIAQIDAAMQAQQRLVEETTRLGDALVQALRRQAQEQDAAAQEAARAQQEAAQKAARAQSEAAQASARATQEGLRAQIEATRRAASAQVDAIRDSYDAQIDAAQEAAAAQQEALRDTVEATRRAAAERKDQARDAADAEIAAIDHATDVAVADIQRQIDALDALDEQDRRGSIESRLQVTYENRARYDLQQQLRALDRAAEKKALSDQAKGVKDAGDIAKKTIKDRLDIALDAIDMELQARLDALDLQKRAERKQSDARIEQLRDQKEAAVRSAQATAQAQIDALDAQVDAARKSAEAIQASLRQQESAARDSYRRNTSDYEFEARARELIEGEHWEEIMRLIETYYPEWATAGLTLGQQIILGLKNSGVKQVIDDILKRPGQPTTPPSGGGGFPPPGGAPTTPPGTYIGVPNSQIVEGWNLVTTGGGGSFNVNDFNAALRIFLQGANNQPGQDVTGTGLTIGPNYPLWIYRPKGVVLDFGGLVMGPTNAMLAQNSVPELVLPLPQAMKLLGQGRAPVTVDLRGSQFLGTPAENGDAIGRAVERALEEAFGRDAFLGGVN